MPKYKSTALPAALPIHLLHPIPSNNIHHSIVFTATHFLTRLLLSSAAFIVIALLFPYLVCVIVHRDDYLKEKTHIERKGQKLGETDGDMI